MDDDDRKPAAKKRTTGKKQGATSSKKRKASRCNDDTSSSLSAVLPWIPRAQLEALITSSINNRSAITTDKVIKAMPEHEQWRIDSSGKKKKSYSPVKGGPERVNTGAFDAIDATTMLNIFMHLNCKEKHTCVTSVCKGWREFKASMPRLFLDLSDDSWNVRGGIKMTAEKTLTLMNWVPHLSQITALRIRTDDKCNPNTCKQIVKALVAAKKKDKAPQITKLVLHGPKIYGSLIPELIKNEVGKNLTSLIFRDVSITQKTKLGAALPDLFKSLPRLEELDMPQSAALEMGNINPKVMSPLRTARSGASTLLRVLDLGKDFWGNKFSLEAISKLGTSAPELEVLRIGSVQRQNGRRISAMFMGFGEELSSLMGDPAERALASPMTCLPRLKEFSLARLVDSYAYGGPPKYATTEEVNRLLSWLLAGMPAVESFSFTHGETSMSKKEEKKHSYPPLPGIVSYGGGELMWPHSLKHLSLSSFYLEADTFTENTEFPSLTSLKLTRCGGNVDTIINNLRRTHPNVEVTKVESRW